MENTAHGHKSSVGPSRGEDEARNSDSGDSVFLTQKPLPEAVRSGGRRLPRSRSAYTQEGPTELEDDIFSSSSSSEEESRTKRKKRRRVLKVPSCRFSFLTERKGQTNDLLRVKIKKLHSYMIGGYMKHVQELWESYERGDDVAASLPTVDVDEEELSPVSEEEKDEAVEDEDIKVVERKDFATSIKAKSSKPWCASKARSNRKRNLSTSLNGSPGQQKTLPEVSTSEPMFKETPSATMQTSRDEDTLCAETESQVTSDGKTGERPKEKNRRDESSETLGPESHTQEDGDPHTEVLHLDQQGRLGNFEHENGSLSQSDANDTLYLKKRRKNKEDKDVCEHVEKEKKQDGTEGQHEEELLSVLKDINMKDVPESKPKKKKPASEDGRQDDGSVEEASVASSKTQADWKKQKKDDDVDGGRTDPAAEPLTDEDNKQKTKNKKKKDPNVTLGFSGSPTEHHVENTEAPQETPSFLLREPKFTKRKDKKMKHSASAAEDVKFCNDAVTNTDSSSQTKKADMSDAAEEDEKVVNKQIEEQAPELKTKKKKKKKPASEDGRQDDGSVEELSVASSKTQADWKKKDDNVDGGRTDPAAEPLTDEANVRKKKKKKKKDPNVTSDLCESPFEHHVENTEAPQETPSFLLREPKFIKEKDKKMKHSASAAEDVKFCNDTVTNTDSSSQTKKADMSDAAEEDEKVVNKQIEEQAPGLKTKKKKKKKKPASEDGRQDDGSVEELSVASSKTQADWKKQKKDDDVDGGRTDPAAEPLTDEANVRKKKKKKKKDPNVTSDLCESPFEHHVENTEAPQETPSFLLREPKFIKEKDKKMKHSASAGEDVKFCNDTVTNTDSSSQTKMVDTSDAAEGDKQKEERAPELKAKKKKQKKNLSVATCEDTVAEANSSALVRKKEKKAMSSFLAADEEENGAEERHESLQSAAETLHFSASDLAANSAESSERLKDGTRNKKKKKKNSAVQEGVGGETGFKEPKGTPAVEVKKKRKCERSDSELMSPTDLSLEESQTDADVPLKKKKKKKDKIPPAASEDDESEASTQLSSDSQKRMLKKKMGKAENKLSLSPKPADSEACKTKQTEKNDFNLGSKAPPLSLKRKNKKRKLYDASQDFLSDF